MFFGQKLQRRKIEESKRRTSMPRSLVSHQLDDDSSSVDIGSVVNTVVDTALNSTDATPSIDTGTCSTDTSSF